MISASPLPDNFKRLSNLSNMKLQTLLIYMILLCPGIAFSQYMEVGISGGFSQYFGDLQYGYEARENNAAFGVFARYNLKRQVAIKGQLSQATLSGSDALQRQTNSFESNRNLSFQSRLFELAVQGEWNITQFDIRDDKVTAPYLFAGVAAIYNSPRAQIDGKWYDLQSIGTEGQTLEGGKKYSKLNVAFPIGAGFKVSLSERLNIGFEFGVRLTMSDYLDDVSGTYPNLALLEEVNPIASQLSFRSPEILPQLAGNPVGKPRGNPNDNDSYFMGSITFSFNLVEGYDLEFDERLRKFSPNYKPKMPKLPNLKSTKRELRKEEKIRAKAKAERTGKQTKKKKK